MSCKLEGARRLTPTFGQGNVEEPQRKSSANRERLMPIAAVAPEAAA